MGGFVDLQVNGYGGVDFGDPSLTVDDVARTAERLASLGTAAFLPTVVTAPAETYERVLPVLAEAARSPTCAGRVLGIHLEGPFVSPEDGARGAHPLGAVQRPSTALLERLLALANGTVRLLTLAPELPGAAELIACAKAHGVAVAIGHTLADAAAIDRAVRAGATLSTHLGNGCPNTMHRHDNPLWPQLAAPALSAMVVSDGHHLPPAVLRAILAAKGTERVIVTSDAAPPAGCPPGEYGCFGTRVRLEPSGRLVNLKAPTLAGSSATMLDCINHLAGLGGWSEADLWRMGRDNPLAAIGRTAADVPDAAPVLRYEDGAFRMDR